MVGKVGKMAAVIAPAAAGLGMLRGFTTPGMGFLQSLGKGLAGGARGFLDPMGSLKTGGTFRSPLGFGSDLKAGSGFRYAPSGGGGFLGGILGQGQGGSQGGLGALFGGQGGGANNPLMGLIGGATGGKMNFGQNLLQNLPGIIGQFGMNKAQDEQAKQAQYGYDIMGNPANTADWERMVGTPTAQLPEYLKNKQAGQAAYDEAFKQGTDQMEQNLIARGVSNSGEAIRRASDLSFSLANQKAQNDAQAFTNAQAMQADAQARLAQYRGLQSQAYQNVADAKTSQAQAPFQMIQNIGGMLMNKSGQQSQNDAFQMEAIRQILSRMGVNPYQG